MSETNTFTSLQWARWREVALKDALGWLPRLLMGPALRRTLYRQLFRKMGDGVFIDTDVEILNAAAIEIGNKVCVRAGVRLDARSPGNRLVLKSRSFLERGVMIMAMRQTTIEVGEGTLVGPYSVLAGPGHLTIGNNCLIAAHAGIFANNHRFADPELTIREQGVSRQGIVIEDDCWLGHAVSVLDGVTIGRGSVIGAGAVVTQNIPPYSVAVGVPARVIRRRDGLSVTPQSRLVEQGMPDTLKQALRRAEQALEHLEKLRLEVSAVLLQVIFAELLHRLFEEIRTALDVDTVTLLLPRSSSQDLFVYNTIGLEEEIEQQVRIPLGQGVAGQIAADIQPLIVENLAQVEVASPVLRNRGVQSLLGVPLHLGKQQVGVFHVGSFQRRHFTGEDTCTVESVAERIGPLIRIAQYSS
ncbi:GAF domain-containing protein [Gloeobacter morelensis]|nr:GAF domain-containing protein [Gloeobacter morelensis]